MTHNLKIAATIADTGNNALAALFNGGKLRFYTGTQPADTTGATTTLLCECALANPALGGSSSGVLTFNAIASGTAVATGIATWARFFKSDGTTPLLDCAVGTSGSDINLTSTSINTGDVVTINSLTLTFPEP